MGPGRSTAQAFMVGPRGAVAMHRWRCCSWKDSPGGMVTAAQVCPVTRIPAQVVRAAVGPLDPGGGVGRGVQSMYWTQAGCERQGSSGDDPESRRARLPDGDGLEGG